MRIESAAVLAAQGEGLASICFRTSDIAKMHRRLDRLTLKPDAGRRGRKPRRDLRRDAVMEAHARGNGGHARRPPVLPRARQGAAAVGANHDGLDHGDGSCRGLDVGSRAGRRPLWRAARPRHGARSLAPGLGPADVLPLRRPDCRGHAPAGQGDGYVAGPAARPVLARLRHRRHPCAAGSGRRRRLGSPHRPQAGNAGDDGAQRHMRRPDAAGAAVGGADDVPLPLWERVAPNEVRRR